MDGVEEAGEGEGEEVGINIMRITTFSISLNLFHVLNTPSIFYLWPAQLFAIRTFIIEGCMSLSKEPPLQTKTNCLN